MNPNQRASLSNIVKLALFLSLAYFPFFLHLENLPIRIWDESRLAINAYEMHKNGHYLVTYFNGSPDMWNTKPPLMIWLQVGCIKIFGNGELAIRLPAAIAGLLTASSLLLFGVKYVRDYWFGMIAAMVLITSYGYINIHVTRTGDYDSLLILFMTLYALFYFLFTEKEDKKYLHLFFITLALAVLTKSIQGLLFTPALLIYMVITKKFNILKEKWFYLDAILFLLVVGSYYGLRELYNPGYLQAVWDNELGGRYLTVMEEHQAGFMTYFHLLVKHHFSNWYWLIPPAIIIGFLTRDDRIRKLSLFSSLVVITYWLIISYSKTKLEWYEAPLFPFLALMATIVIHTVFTWIKNAPGFLNAFRWNVVPFAFLLLVFLFPYKKMIGKVYFPKEYEWENDVYPVSYLLQEAVRSKENLPDFNLCYEGYCPQLQFYTNKLADMGRPVAFKDWQYLQAGEKIVTSQSEIQKNIESNYKVDILRQHHSMKEYIIHERTQANGY